MCTQHVKSESLMVGENRVVNDFVQLNVGLSHGKNMDGRSPPKKISVYDY